MLEKEKKKERKIREKKRETERERERIERAWKMISFKCVCVYLSVLAYAWMKECDSDEKKKN